MKELRHHLGKYSGEITNSFAQEKYEQAGLRSLLAHRFNLDSSVPRLTIDSKLDGLQFIFTGNTIRVSQGVVDHPAINLHNMFSDHDAGNNPRASYDPSAAPSIACLMCQIFLRVEFTAFVDTVIYVKYDTEFETVHSSMVEFVINDTVQVDIVEEVISYGLHNVVTNYRVGSTAKLRLHTLYNNSAGGNSLLLRNVRLGERAGYTHGLLGHSSNVILDETRIFPKFRSNSRLTGITSSENRRFQSVLTVHPESDEYVVAIDYRNIITSRSNVGFYAGVAGDNISDRSYVNVVDLNIDQLSDDVVPIKVAEFAKEVMDTFAINGRRDAERFYQRKNNFKIIQ